MWRLEVSDQEAGTVLEHEDVAVRSSSFSIVLQGEQLLVPGFTVSDADGNPIESVGGVNSHERSLELNEEGLVCIKGLWVHFDKETSQHRFGFVDAEGGFVSADDLGGRLDDPMLQRQWNLSFHMDGAELLASGRAAGYGGSDPD